MQFTIKYKLFLTLLLATVIVVVVMVFLVKWSFERGFLDYVNKVEQEIHSNLVSNLSETYQENGSWEFIRENPRQWEEIHRSSIPLMEERENIHEGGAAEKRWREGHKSQNFSYRRGSPPFGKHRRGKACLLDVNKDPITHCRDFNDDTQMREIIVTETVVGYLAIAPRKKLTDGHDLHFSRQQHRFLLLLGLCLGLISVLVAFPVSRQLVKPINKLAQVTRKLAAGQYQTRIAAESSDELGDLSRDFNILATSLESNEQARQQWIGDISHELRTPLSVLRGEIEALQDGLREVNPGRLESLHKQVMNLNRLVTDLYELSMSDIGALNYQKSVVDIVAILQRSVESLRDEFMGKEINITYEQNAGSTEIFADDERLQQLFTNLLTNTLRYTDNGGELGIQLEVGKGKIIITMEDSFPGVSDNDLRRLFERLYRVDSSRNRETGGTGLGLAICKNIVDAHGGTISAELSTLGGLKINIELPRD